MGAWVQKNYGGGKVSSFYRQGTTAGPIMSESITRLAIKGIQDELVYLGYKTRTDGLFDAGTTAAMKAWQAANGLTADGIFGPKSSRILFDKRLTETQAKYGIPKNYLKGMVSHESGFDPGAIGVNGMDSGLVQINLDPVGGHGNEFTIHDAFNPAFSIEYAGKRMAAAKGTYSTALDALAWELAVGQHNSPLNARHWRDAALNIPPGPVAEDSLVRIESNSKYVQMIDDAAPDAYGTGAYGV